MAGSLRVVFLGRLAGTAGGGERIWPPSGTLEAPIDGAAFIAALTHGDPDLAAALFQRSVRMIVNQQVTPRTGVLLHPGDVVAFAPPEVGDV
ncbi:MAG: MoaD/ThiS family protein [Hyphomonadaceae bacterium]